MRKIMNFLRSILVFLLTLILLANLYFIGARLIGGQMNPKLFGFSYSIVLSGSMQPAFDPGDLLVYKQQDTYMIGDVVMFRHGNTLVTHRIVEETEDGFITQGDANNAVDTDILNPADIEGEMVAIVPNLGDVLLFLRTPLGFLTLIFIGLLFLELPGVIKLLHRKKGRHEA